VRRAVNLATFMCRRLYRNYDGRSLLEPSRPVQTCTGTAVQTCTGTAVQTCTGTAVQTCTGTAVLYVYLNCCLLEESFKMLLEETNHDRSYLIHRLEVKG
jgi:hypothetical protein